MIYIILFLYLAALLFIFLYSLGQLHLTWYYLKGKNTPQSKNRSSHAFDITEAPHVTVQLPVYNERYVIERLIDAICAFEYPKNKLEVQILDDSTDETSALIREKIKEYREQEFDIKHIQRKDRKNFKAGALQHGLQLAEGDFIAIFDADFIPSPDFLISVIPEFQNEHLGMVQTRWGHVNEDYSLLTKLQAFGLNAHFSVEQGGRSVAGSFINFNGTAGVWRKTCILDAGGWSADTLTEDLDLSYRAQFKGWKFKYLEEIESPAELPIFMTSVKSQQYRWNKGAAETAKKHLLQILSSGEGYKAKVHALFHLFNSTIFICILIAAFLSVPLLFMKQYYPEFNFILYIGSVFFMGFLSITIFYMVASKAFSTSLSISKFWRLFPLFLIVSMGLSLHNAVAAIEGFLGRKTPFVRTPKFNIRNKNFKIAVSPYLDQKINAMTIAEGMLCLYFLCGAGAGILMGDYSFIIFHLMLGAGFAIVFYYSIKPSRYA